MVVVIIIILIWVIKDTGITIIMQVVNRFTMVKIIITVTTTTTTITSL